MLLMQGMLCQQAQTGQWLVPMHLGITEQLHICSFILSVDDTNDDTPN